MENVMKWSGFEITDTKRTLTALLLIPVLLIGSACSFTTWVDRANQIITTATPAVSLILTLLPLFGTAVPSSVANSIRVWTPQVTNGLTLLAGLLVQFQNAASADQPAILDKIQAEIAVLKANLADILPVLHVLNTETQAKITALVNAIGDAVQEVAVLVAAVQGKTQLARARAARVTFVVKDAKAFKKHFNEVLHAPTGNAVVDAATAQVALK